MVVARQQSSESEVKAEKGCSLTLHAIKITEDRHSTAPDPLSS
jgi:hypothetical protein